MRTDYRIRATAAEGLMRVVAVVTTGAAREAQLAHQCLPVAAAAMGRMVSTVAILGSDMKEEPGRITVEVNGDGPLGRVVAEVRPNGHLRARVQNPSVDLPLRADGKLAVGQAVGDDGYFRVLRQDSVGDWYQGQVALQSGEIGEDFLHYLTQSEQVPSAVSLGVLVGQEGLVIGSGGILVQALPGCEPQIVDEVAAHFSALSNISRRLADGEPLDELVRSVIREPIHWLGEEPLKWQCWCEREPIRDSLKGLPDEDIQDLIGDGGAEIICNFCRTRYHFSIEELQSFRGDAS